MLQYDNYVKYLSEWAKIRTRKTLNIDTFHAVSGIEDNKKSLKKAFV